MAYQVVASLVDSLPDGWVLERAAGPASRQTGPAVDGTTFIEYWTSGHADEPRFSYSDVAGGRGLLVEPGRTNHWWSSDFADTNGDDQLEGGYITQAGVPGTAFNVLQDSGPHGGDVLRLEDVATADRGIAQDLTGLGATLAAATQHSFSVWVRRTAGGAAAIYTLELNPGTPTVSLDAGPHDWKRRHAVMTTVGVGRFAFLEASGDPPGVVDLVMPQAEVGPCRSSWIPSGAADATRAAERCRFTGTRGMGTWWRKRILLDVFPEYGSTEDVGTPRLFGLTADDYIAFQAADDRIVVVNGGSIVAQSAPLAFAAGERLSLHIELSPYAVALGVNGAFSDSGGTGWSAPASVTPHIGSDVAGGNAQPALYRNLSVL